MVFCDAVSVHDFTLLHLSQGKVYTIGSQPGSEWTPGTHIMERMGPQAKYTNIGV